MPSELPWHARRFLQTTANVRVHAIVHAFHRWLNRRQLTLAELTPGLVRQFVARPRRARVTRRGRRTNQAWLRYYMQWLHDRGLVAFVPPPGRP